MKPISTRSSRQKGAIILPLILVVFALALLTAGWVGRLLWYDADRSWPRLLRLAQTRTLAPTVTVTPSTVADPLVPAFVVDPALRHEHAELERQLLRPLRAYYATKLERLGNVAVAPSDVSTHQTLVTFELVTTSGIVTHRFYYDKPETEEKKSYPRWEPGLLDVTK